MTSGKFVSCWRDQTTGIAETLLTRLHLDSGMAFFFLTPGAVSNLNLHGQII